MVLIQTIYMDNIYLIQNKELNKIAKYVILSVRNADVDEINKQVMELLHKFEEQIYTSTDSTCTNSTENCDDNDDLITVTLVKFYYQNI